MFPVKLTSVFLRLAVFLFLLFFANLTHAALLCTETPVDIHASLLWAGASPNDVSTLNGSTSTPGHLQGRLKQCIPDGSVEGEQGTFEWLPAQAGDDAYFVGEINGPNSVALNGPDFGFVSIRMGNANFTGSLLANDVVIQDYLLDTKMNFNGVTLSANNSILIDSNDGEETPDQDLTLNFNGGGLAAVHDINIGALARAVTKLDMNGSILNSDTLSIQPDFDGGGFVDMTFTGGQSEVTKDVMIGRVINGETNLTIDNSQVNWAGASGFTTIGHSGDVNMTIKGGADVNTHETFIGFAPESNVEMTIENSKWTAGNLVVGGFGDVQITANAGSVLASKNTTIGSFVSPEVNDGKVTLNGDAKWDIDGFLTVGSQGKGILTLNDDSTVNVFGPAIIGLFEGSDGQIDVHSGNTLNVTEQLEVGRDGGADLNIFQGGHVDVGGDLFVASFQHGNGTIDIDGGLLTVDGNVNIGNGTPGVTERNGVANVRIDNGGTLEFGSDKQLRIGRREGTRGSLSLFGPDSRVLGGDAVAQGIQVGLDGEGDLGLFGGATLGNAEQDLVVGINEKGKGDLTVVNSGSLLKADNLILGDQGLGTGKVFDGAKIEIENNLTIGKVNKGANKLEVFDAGRLEIGGELTIGEEGNGELELNNGGVLDMQGFNSKVTLGKKANSSGVLTLIGSGPHLAADTQIIIGDEGSGVFNLREGAEFKMNSLILGEKATSTGQVFATGQTTLFEVADNLTVGDAGQGTIDIREGATLKTGTDNPDSKTILAQQDNGKNSSVSIRGQGSLWESSNDIIVGSKGLAHIDALDGAKIDAAKSIILGDEEGSIGDLLIGALNGPAGVPSEVSYTVLTVGKNGQGSVIVSGGGLLTGKDSNTAVVLAQGNTAKGDVTVKDENSKWLLNNTAGLTVGASGTGSIQVQNGALVEMNADSEFILGQNAGSVGRLTVEGGADSAVPGDLPSRFLSGKNVTIGQGGEGRLLITDGAEFKAADDADMATNVGTQAGGRGVVGVQGEDSIWNTGELKLGDAGEAAVSVTEGGVVNSDSVVMKGNAAHTTRALFDFSEWNLFNFDAGTNTQLDLEGSSRFNVRGTSNIDGGVVNAVNSQYDAAGSDVNVAHDGSLAVRRDLSVFNAGNLNLVSGGSMGLFDQSTANIDNKMTVDGGKAFVFLDSKLKVGQQLDVKNGGLITTETGQVTVGSATTPLERGLTVGAGGLLSGNGTIFGNVLVEGGGASGFTGGTVKPGNSPGKLNIEGNFFLGTGAILGLEVAGTQAGFYDQLAVTGMAQFAPDSFIEFTFLDGFLPKAGDNFAFITADNGIEGLSNDHFRFKDIDQSFMYDLKVDSGRFTLAALNDAQPVVPEPATMALMFPGLAGMFWTRRRRK